MIESTKVDKCSAIATPSRLLEKYTPRRKAEFILANATNAADYRRARKAVKRLGIDPDLIPPNRLA